MNIKTTDIEIAVSSFLNTRANLIVPNISWGLHIHECDLLFISRAGYATEVEIKISRQDLIKDKLKDHKHVNSKIKYLYFAIPDYLMQHINHIPERAGIIVVDSKKLIETLIDYRKFSIGCINYLMGKSCRVIKKAKVNNRYKFTYEERLKVATLGTMRIWKLKQEVQMLERQVDCYKLKGYIE